MPMTPRSLRWMLALSLSPLLPLAACEGCGTAVTSDGGTPEPSATVDDGGPQTWVNDAGQTIIELPDGGQGVVLDDGGIVPLPEPDAGPDVASDGGATNDAGDPLEQPIDQFCEGQGPVVQVGEGGPSAGCSGEIAEERFRFALCACDNIAVDNGQLNVDAFDSSLGGYGVDVNGTPNISDDGQVGVNGGPLLLERKLDVGGSLYVGGGDFRAGASSAVGGNLVVSGNALSSNGGAFDVGRNAIIDGNLEANYVVHGDLIQPATATNAATVEGNVVNRAIPAQEPCACDAEDILDIASLTSWAETHNDNAALDPALDANGWASDGGGDLTLPCGRYYLSSVQQSGTFSITAQGRVALFIDGDVNVGGLQVNVDDGAELDLFIAGDFAVNSAASLGSIDRPASVRTYIAGTASMQASANFGGNIYAPQADITFSASSEVYGSLFVNSVTFQAAANVHFDSAVRRLGDSCDEPVDDDAGVPVDDGGVTPPTDAGAPPTDAGTTPTDAGAPPDDAGMSMMDAGTPTPGPECSDVCSNDCAAGESCLMDGMGGGVCGACVTDLDCCAPSLCFAGVCLAFGE